MPMCSFVMPVASGALVAVRRVNRTPVLAQHTMSVREWHYPGFLSEVSDSTTSLAPQTGTRYLTEQLSDLSLTLLVVVMADLCRGF
jgi:hypothetical protein